MSAVIFIILFILIYFAILKRPFKLHEGTIALIGAVLVLLFGIISPKDAVDSIIGTYSHPWQIIIFFITFAIISTTLEDLGFFRWCAIHTTNLAKHNGKKLFNYLFIVTAIITFLTANDIVILTLTPFVLHLGLHHNKHPKAYLYMLFFVANTGSLGHLLGNLTNIIVSDTFQISFLSFLKYLFVPMIAALIVEYFILRWYFKKEINQTFTVNKKIKPHHAIVDKTKVGMVLAILFFVIVLALFEPLHGINLWIITTVGALLTILIGRFNPIKRIARVPWQVILFVTSLFVIITGFAKTGILDYFSSIISTIQSKSLFGITILGSYLSSFIAAIMNNIPGTITMSNILAESSLSGINQQSVIYSTIIGSNLGANFTIIGALAGLMWIHLIREKNYHITAFEFSKIGIMTMIPTVFVVGLILFIELILF
jgi:arsenical pump membrane protein